MNLSDQSRSKMKMKQKSKFFLSNVDNIIGKSQFDPNCNTVNQINEGQDCPCNSPSCPPCILSKTQRKMHERASKDARADQNTQQILVKESDLQEKLFGAAMKYAGEVAAFEEEAKELALKMQKVASSAEISRTKMIKAENQAKQLAMKTINTMTVYPPHSATKTPELTITNAGFTQTMIKQYEPQYSIKIGETDSNGYIDPVTQSVYQDAAAGSSGRYQTQNQQPCINCQKQRFTQKILNNNLNPIFNNINTPQLSTYNSPQLSETQKQPQKNLQSQPQLQPINYQQQPIPNNNFNLQNTYPISQQYPQLSLQLPFLSQQLPLQNQFQLPQLQQQQIATLKNQYPVNNQIIQADNQQQFNQ